MLLPANETESYQFQLKRPEIVQYQLNFPINKTMLVNKRVRYLQGRRLV